MGRPPCCEKVGVKKGPWTPEEDIILVSYIQEHGPGNWRSVPTNAGELLFSFFHRIICRVNCVPQSELLSIRYRSENYGPSAHCRMLIPRESPMRQQG